MFGISGLLTSLPNFLTSNGNVATPRNGSVAQAQNRLCLLERHDNTTFTEKCALESASEMSRDRDSQWVVIFISCMMLIQGVAKAPRSALSSLYIDNNSPKIKTGFYIGILMSFSIFGPVIAVVLGGVFNKMPVDLKETSMSPSDPRWIGAWWLGFILFGALSCLISIPIFFFPASLRKNGNQASNVYANSEILEQKTLVQPIKDLPRSLGRVLKRPVYTCTMISVLFYLFGIMAMGSFGPKYIENQFHVPTWKANWVMGIEKLAPTVIGTFVGGVITRRLRLGLTGSVKMVFIIRIVVFALSCLNFMFGCPNPNVIIGMPTEVSSIANTFHSGTNISLIASTTCACSDVTYLPVCADDQTWFSPCHAGCQTEKQRMYYNCTATLGGTASPGMCTKGCDMLIPFVAVNALASFIGTLGLSPNYIVLLRSVGVNDRSMGVALMSFLMALLVFMPAPIVFGKVFDAFCLVWKNKCSGRGSCLLYDVIDLRFHLVGINVALAFISVVLVGISVLFALRLKDPDADDVGDKKLSMKPPIPQPRTSLTSQKGDGDGNVDRSDKR
ncbi:solute carrier organic anion transporter family member 1C1-like [Dreissena polymorpha]|nr:solute carrier organic anion transporter family member 1C1-like [Dreissena polymorpha]